MHRMVARLPLLLMLVAGASLAAQAPPAASPQPQSQPPVFRTGVDLLSVDATVVDRDGRQVTDLRPEEFVVEVDGDARPVVSAEYISLADAGAAPAGGASRPAAAPAQDDYFSTNARVLRSGRLILLLVDQGNIRSGEGRRMMRSAAAFVDRLLPDDRVAMVAIPRGTLVDFTTEHERVREALLATVGQASPYKGRFYMSLSEAIATVEHSDAVLRTQLILRECAAVLSNPVELTRCEIEVEQEAGEYVNHQRQQTQASLSGLRAVLKSLAALEGPKSVILISEGMVLEGLGGDMDEVAAIAADVRASLDIMLLDVPSVDVTQSQRPSTPREDREREIAGLEMLAGMSRGALHRILSSGDQAFSRIVQSLAGHYLIGVEARRSDRDGRRHRISVKTTRRGVTVRARRGFLADVSPAATTPADAVGRALKAPLTINDLPMRLGTWTYKEPGGSKVRLLITAEVERTADQSTTYTAGLVLVDRDSRVVANMVEERELRTHDATPGVAVFSGTLMVDPGSYLLRVAVADSTGRLGSVQRSLDAWQMNSDTLTVGDLLVGEAPRDGGAVAPAIEPVVANGRLVAMMEVYAPGLASDTVRATLDVLANEQAKPLLSMPLQVGAGSSPEIGAVQGVVSTAALPPGRYLARATIHQGGEARGHITRPFRVGASARAADASAVPATVPREMMASLLAAIPDADPKALATPEVLGLVLTTAEAARPAAKAAFAAARRDGLGPAALEALSAGDQVAAAFLRGVELFTQGQLDRAVQQLQLAMQQAPTFAPARLYLGAALAHANRHREAAGLLHSVDTALAGAAPVARLAAIAWLRAGDPANAVTALERAHDAGDASIARTLAFAYVAAGRHEEALPLLVEHLATHDADQEALLAGVYATYGVHSPSPRTETLAVDRARAHTWARAYAAQRGEHLPLVDAWMAYLAKQ